MIVHIWLVFFVSTSLSRFKVKKPVTGTEQKFQLAPIHNAGAPISFEWLWPQKICIQALN